MFLNWWIVALSICSTISGQLFHVKDLADLKFRISTEVLSDFLLLRSGRQCGRCVAIETLMEKLKKYITIPVYVMRADTIKTPLLELHKLKEQTDDYEIISYNGQLSMSSVLKFIQDAITARTASGFTPFRNREVSDIDTAVERSKKSGGRVPYIFEVRNDQDISLYEDVIRRAEIANADYYLIRDSAIKEPRIIVAHTDEVRLSTSSRDKEELVKWLKVENLPQFGELRGLSDEQRSLYNAWLILVGGPDSYELFQHEFREFASNERSHWRTAWVNKARSDWEAIVQSVLNIEEDIATFGRHIDEQGTASWSCKPDCVIGRQDNVIKYMSTTNLSANKLSEFSETFASGKAGSRTSAESKLAESRVADLKVEFESREMGVIRLRNEDFTEKIRNTSEPVLILLRAADGEKSVELRSVVENVADILLPTTRIKFYEMVDLPPPDKRYAAYDSIPHLWFKPIGIDEDPIAIPWEVPTTPEENGSAALNIMSSSRKLRSIIFLKLSRFARICLLKLKSVLEQVISSLNYNQEL